MSVELPVALLQVKEGRPCGDCFHWQSPSAPIEEQSHHPEVPFSVVGAIVTGLMGVSVAAR